MMDERQTNYTVMEGYELPSKGRIYDKEVNPHIELRSMTARDEMKRLSPSTTPLKTLSDIIEGCCIEKPAIKVYDMCLGDYEFLLHRLRAVTYGEKYNLVCQCSSCKDIIETNADLSSLEVKELDEDLYRDTKIFTLPVSGTIIELKTQTPRLLEDIEARTKEMRRKYKDASLDWDTYCKMLLSIATIDGAHKNPMEMEKFINNLAARDMQKILNNIDLLGRLIGLDNILYVTCPKCGIEIRTFFRYGSEFFRPSDI
jgi:hypothetical protein